MKVGSEERVLKEGISTVINPISHGQGGELLKKAVSSMNLGILVFFG
jgi:hypothetical protein